MENQNISDYDLLINVLQRLRIPYESTEINDSRIESTHATDNYIKYTISFRIKPNFEFNSKKKLIRENN